MSTPKLSFKFWSKAGLSPSLPFLLLRGKFKCHNVLTQGDSMIFLWANGGCTCCLSSKGARCNTSTAIQHACLHRLCRDARMLLLPPTTQWPPAAPLVIFFTLRISNLIAMSKSKRYIVVKILEGTIILCKWGHLLRKAPLRPGGSFAAWKVRLPIYDLACEKLVLDALFP